MKVLIADDNANIRQIIRHVLTSDLGAEIREASDGLEVLEMLKEGHCDLLVLDIEMEPLGGVETLQAIRRADAWRALPVVVISGIATPDAVKRVKSLGVEGFVAKPLSLALLRERLVPIVRQLSEAPPRAAGRKAHLPISLKPATQVWLVGGEEPDWGELPAQLSTVSRVTHWPDAIRAARQAAALKPDLVFVTWDSSDILSPGLFAKALRRERGAAALVLCGDLDECSAADRAFFDGEVPFSRPPMIDEVLGAIGPIVTEGSLGLLVLRTDANVTDSVAEAMRSTLESTLGAPVVMAKATPAAGRDEAAMEAWVPLSVGEAVWTLRIVMPARIVVKRAREIAGAEDLVSHVAALECAKEDVAAMAATVTDALMGYGIRAAVGAPSSRTLPTMELPGWHMSGRANHWQSTAGAEVVALLSLETPELRTPLARGEAARKIPV